MAAKTVFIFMSMVMLMNSAIAWTNMADRLKDLVIHIESRREGFEKNWVIRSAYHDSEWTYYSKFTKYSDYEVYSAENTKWLVKDCGGGYLCFESVECQDGKLPFRNRYIRAAYPYDDNTKLPMLKEEYSPELHDEYHHKIECEDATTMMKCRISSKRFSGLYWANEWIEGPPGGPDEHYVHYNDKEYERYFRILAPEPSDYFTTIYEGTNEGNVATPPYTKSMTIGTESSSTYSQTVTESTSIEVSASFFKFGGTSTSQTVSSSWTESSTEVWSASITKTYQFSIEPRSHLKVKQLKGTYGDSYDIFSENYYYEVDYLDDKSKSYKSKTLKLDLDAKLLKLVSEDVKENATRIMKNVYAKKNVEL